MVEIQAQTPQNGQAHSNNSSAVANEVCECVWPFLGLAYKGLNALAFLVSYVLPFPYSLLLKFDWASVVDIHEG